jgi:hypothetical protein
MLCCCTILYYVDLFCAMLCCAMLCYVKCCVWVSRYVVCVCLGYDRVKCATRCAYVGDVGVVQCAEVLFCLFDVF